ncbi:MAG TPA: T9SS type A sorting domain-containing protein [Bacteroidia bacterium]|nr:T9SS type A sorting domain-containing protein [Bacteroidia bacterium]
MTVLLCGGMKLAAQDIAPGINYSYDPPGSDGVIHNITVDVVNNDNTGAGSFDVAMYLYDQSSGNHWVIGTTNIPSLSGNSLITISSWDIDINNTPGIPAGTYRLGIWVDSNDDISETDENNNTGLLAGNISYNPSASGIASAVVAASSVTCFPNPANVSATFTYSLTQNTNVSVKLYDITGNLVSTLSDNEQSAAGDHQLTIDTSSLPDGVYFITLSTGEESVVRRVVVSH